MKLLLIVLLLLLTVFLLLLLLSLITFTSELYSTVFVCNTRRPDHDDCWVKSEDKSTDTKNRSKLHSAQCQRRLVKQHKCGHLKLQSADPLWT